MNRKRFFQFAIAVLFVGFSLPCLCTASPDLVYYIGTDSHVHELRYVSSWATTDLMTATGATDASGSYLAGYFLNSGNYADAVYYIATDGDIHELAYYGSPTPSWHTLDISNLSSAKAPATTTALTAEISGSNQNVYYIATDGDIHQITCSGNPCTWSTTDVTSTSGATKPLSTGYLEMTSHAYQTSDNIYYVASDGDIHQCSYYSSSWHTANVTSLASARSPDAGTLLGGQAIGTSDEVYYIASDGDLHNLAYSSGWTDSNLTSSASAPAPAAGTWISANVFSTEPGVYFIDGSGNLRELYYTGSSWSTVNVTSSSSGPTPGSGTAIWSHVFGSAENIYYFASTDSDVHESSYYSSSWHASNPSSSASAPTAVGGWRMVSFVGY